jgi:hypothetical protein
MLATDTSKRRHRNFHGVTVGGVFIDGHVELELSEEKCMTEKIVSIRVPAESIRALRQLARRESVKQQADVSWADIVRELIAKTVGSETKENR